MKKKLLFLLAAVFLTGYGAIYGQGRTASGTVFDSETKEALIGVNVLVKGTTTGTITDVNGKFELPIPEGSNTLEFSYTGYATQELSAKSNMSVFLISAEVLTNLEIVGYGTVKDKGYAGSAQAIDAKIIETKSPSEITKALMGEFSGVQVATTSGQPGSTSSVRLRGVNTLSSGTEPLYVVDGVPYNGDITSIDPSDIASTTILKDATATSLYGSRGSNGVVLITTKKGTAGAEGRIDVDLKYGANMRIIPLYETVNDRQYIELGWLGFYTGTLQKKSSNFSKPITETMKDDAGDFASENIFSISGVSPKYNYFGNSDGNPVDGKFLIDPNTGKFYKGITNRWTPESWAKNIFHTGQKMEANVKFSGGSEKTTYYVAIGFLNDEGYYIQSDWKRFNVRANLDFQPKKWLNGNLNVSYAYHNMSNPGQGDNMNSGFQYVNGCPPIYPVFLHLQPNGTIPVDPYTGGKMYDYGDNINYDRAFGFGINPAGALRLDKSLHGYHDLSAISKWEVEFYKDLKFTANVGYQYFGQTSSELTNMLYGDAAGVGRIDKMFYSVMGIFGNQMLRYQKTFKDIHNFDAFAVHESQIVTISRNDVGMSQLYNPNGIEFGNAAVMSSISGNSVSEMLDSYFGQIRYNYGERYFIEGNMRYDGSSKFAKGHRWGLFGSVGASWVITKEKFMTSTKKWLSHLKLRTSFGTTGNQDIGSFGWTDRYAVRTLDGMPALVWAAKGNENLTWETTQNLDVGVEMNILKDKFYAEITYYDKQTKNLLVGRSVAPSLGYNSVPSNSGKIGNRGLEIALKSKAVKTRNVELSLRLNISTNRSRWIEMPMEYRWGQWRHMNGPVGYSLGAINIVEYAGVDPSTGESQWYGYYDENNKYLAGYTETGDLDKDYRNIKWIPDVFSYLNADTIGGAKINPNAKLVKTIVKDYRNSGSNYLKGKLTDPTVFGGFGFDLLVHGFEVSATLVYQIGGYNYDGVYMQLMDDKKIGEHAWHKDMLDAWNPIAGNTNTNVPRLTGGMDAQSIYVNAGSTRFLTSNSCLQLSNVKLAYQFPQKWTKKALINKLSVWIQGDNLFIWTARKGYFPLGNFEGGSDRSQYLPLSTIIGGVKLQF